jgi:hypothetical protein
MVGLGIGCFIHLKSLLDLKHFTLNLKHLTLIVPTLSTLPLT